MIFDKNYDSCNSCGDGLSEDECYWAEDSTYCESCFYDEFFHCEDCGEAMSLDYRFDDAEDQELCTYCAEDRYQRCQVSERYDLKNKFAMIANGLDMVYIHINTIMSDDRFKSLREFVFFSDQFGARGSYFVQQKNKIEDNSYRFRNTEEVDFSNILDAKTIYIIMEGLGYDPE